MGSYKVLNEITIDGSALKHNLSYFQALNPGIKISPVLKSNAYGHGLEEIGMFVDQSIYCPLICVDSLYEAYGLYKLGVKKDILVMGYTDPANYNVWRNLPFIFSVFDTATLAALAKYQPGARVHIKLDTGLTRLGVTQAELPTFLESLAKYNTLKVEGVFSHLAVADDPSQMTATSRQVRLFKEMTVMVERAGYSPKWRHIAATAGAEVIHDPSFNLVRLGLGFYGYSPFGPHTNEGRRERAELKPALTLTTHIALLKEIEKGTSVGYGASYKAKQAERIAILPLGYNEGISRSLSNKGWFLHGKTICPIVGRVSMNMTSVKLPRNLDARVGDPLKFMSIYEASNLASTITYNTLVSLHPSIRRRVI